MSAPAPAQNTPRSRFTEVISTQGKLGLWVLLSAAFIAAGLGALHALEPGHGKTIVAAYLVGSRGTARHAVLLGFVVTASHTAGVFLLGAVTLYASRYVVPEQLYPWLGAISGLSVAGLGIFIFLRRWTGENGAHSHATGERHAHWFLSIFQRASPAQSVNDDATRGPTPSERAFLTRTVPTGNRRKLGRTVFGLTLPLITNADGTKFGKTEAGAVWLDPARTSVYKFYQYWIRTDDRDVVRYLKFFTFLSQDEIATLEKQHTGDPGARAAHKALAKAFTELVHGPEATAEAMRASEILFGGDLAGVSEATFNEIVGEVPTKEIGKADLDGAGKPLVELLVHGGLCPSKGQARKDIEGGGVYVNNQREASFQRVVAAKDLLFRQTPAPAQRQTQLRRPHRKVGLRTLTG